MIKKEIRIGLIGCGAISTMHMEGYKAIQGVRLISVADIDAKKASVLADKYKTGWYTDYDKMLEKERLDGISICTPPFLHKEIAVAAAKRGINVLCEKPLASNLEDAKEIIEVTSRNNVCLMVGFRHRFIAQNVIMKEMISKGKLGRLLMYRNRFSYVINRENSWASDKKKSGGGALIDHNIHSADLFRWLVGEVKAVSAQVNTLVQNVPVEENGIILLRSKEDLIGVIEGSWTTPGNINVIEVYGSEGAGIFRYDETFKSGSLQVFEKVKNRWSEINIKETTKDFESEFEHFINCIRTNQNPSVTGEDGLKAMQIIDAAYRAVEEEKWISLDEEPKLN